MNTPRNIVIAALGFAVLAVPSTALAEFKPSAELRSARMGDAMKLCKCIPVQHGQPPCVPAGKKVPGQPERSGGEICYGSMIVGRVDTLRLREMRRGFLA